MDRQTIAVIDTDVETSISINSTLRNAGINIHVINPQNLNALAGPAAEQVPQIILYRCRAEPAILLSDLKVWADEMRVEIAILAAPDEPGEMALALKTGTFWFVDATTDEQIVNFVRTALDRASTSRAMARLKRSTSDLEHRMKSLLTGSEEAIAYQLQGLHVFANPAYLAMAGARETSDLEAVSLLELVKGENIRELLRSCDSGSFPETQVSVTFCALDGTEFPAKIEFSPGHFNGENCVQLRVRREDAAAPAKDERDPAMTQSGSMNRHSFALELQSIMASCKHEGLKHALVYLEPDSGRSLSESIGFMQTSEFSRELIETIRASASDGDLFAPIGEAGALVLFMNDEGQRARKLFDEVTSGLRGSDHHESLGAFKSCLSAGCTIIGPQSRDIDEAVQQARTAFRQAADIGNSFRQFEPPRREAREQVSDKDWDLRLRHALHNESFYLVRRNVVDLEGNNEPLFDHRVFLREEHGDTPAREFMGYADNLELGSSIDRLVIPGLLSGISGENEKHILSLSANSVADFSFSSWLQHMVEESQVQKTRLIVELPVSAAVENLRALQRLASELQPRGIGFALGEFDDQQQNLDLLRLLKVSLVRLRPDLDDSLRTNARNQEVVRKIVQAATQTGAKVMVDDVKDAADMAALWQCGVKLVVGDLLQEDRQVSG